MKTAITALFINGDVTAIDKYWADNYIQHNPMFPSGKEVMKEAFGSNKMKIKYEMGYIVGEGDIVMVHGRASGMGPNPMIVVDIFRVENGKIAEHLDVLQEEIPADKTANINSMFSGDK